MTQKLGQRSLPRNEGELKILLRIKVFFKFVLPHYSLTGWLGSERSLESRGGGLQDLGVFPFFFSLPVRLHFDGHQCGSIPRCTQAFPYARFSLQSNADYVSCLGWERVRKPGGGKTPK